MVENIKALHGEFEQYKWEYESFNKNYQNTEGQYTSPVYADTNDVFMQPKKREIVYTGVKVSAKNLILGDSNLMEINKGYFK